MSQALHFVIPGDLMTVTGGYVYDRRIITGLRAIGWNIVVHSLDASFPFPDQLALGRARDTLMSIAENSTIVIDGLALGAMPTVIEEQRQRLRLTALVHHPLAAESGLDGRQVEALFSSEQRALAAVNQIIVTSAATAHALHDYGIDKARISIVNPGTDRAPRSRPQNAITQLLCVATLIPRKGHENLLAALSLLRERPWHLTCVGSFDRSPETTTTLRRQITDLEFQDRVTLLGEVDAHVLRSRYLGADVFVLATRMEGYGMVLSEAMSYGLPIVTTSVGATADTVAPGAGLLVPGDDSQAFAQALAKVIDDQGLREQLAEMSWLTGRNLPTWCQASQAFANQLGGVAGE